MKGLFITFEGTEGSGKSTQIQILTERLRSMGLKPIVLREPGGTPLGEEIRHTLKHSEANRGMTPEAELLLMNASRAQLVREVIRPTLAAGGIVLCDRFYDSTTVYQGHGRGLDPRMVAAVIEVAVGATRPDLTLLLHVPLEVSEARRHSRSQAGAMARDRFEEAERDFFKRVEEGYLALAATVPNRIRSIEATEAIEPLAARIWSLVEPLLETR